MKLNLRKLRKQYSSIPPLRHHVLEFATEGRHKYRGKNR